MFPATAATVTAVGSGTAATTGGTTDMGAAAVGATTVGAATVGVATSMGTAEAVGAGIIGVSSLYDSTVSSGTPCLASSAPDCTSCPRACCSSIRGECIC